MNGVDMLPAGLAAEANRVATTIVDRLSDEDLVGEAVRRSKADAADSFAWDGPSLYGGQAGNALLFAYAARRMADPQRWRGLSQRSLRIGVQVTQQYPMNLASLGVGIAGLALVVERLATDQPKYRSLLHRLRTALVVQITARSDRRGAGGVNPSDYDVIFGDAGVLGYLVSVPQPDRDTKRCCERLIDDLVWMTTPSSQPRWHVPPRFIPWPETASAYPHGYVDLGLAHGITGPLCALSLAWKAGYRRAGLREAIAHTATFLSRIRGEDEFGCDWPRMLPLNAEQAVQATKPEQSAMSWCYGAPGICVALLEAADALGNPQLKSLAAAGLRAAVRRALHGPGGLSSASLCHGWAGLLTICLKFAVRGEDIGETKPLAELTERVLAQCDIRNTLIVKEKRQRLYLDSPSLLDGAAGVPLALWAVSAPMDTRWQRALLIS